MSEQSPFDRAAEILQQVMDLPVEERTSTALKLAGEDDAVVDLLDSMLEGLCEDGSELEKPIVRFPDLEMESMPEEVGGYRIVSKLGQGGMGVVFEAQQASPNRRVAIKLLRGGTLDQDAVKRFEHETAVLGFLNHPGIAHVFEGGVARVGGTDQPFIAMEYLEGQPIDVYANAHSLNEEQRIRLLIDLCDAIQHAHQRGVVHRDLKPGNVMVTVEGQVKVLDFGIARMVETGEESAPGQTLPGQVMGTLSYMSPEQVAADPSQIDTRTDVYGLGVIAYELLAGKRPIDTSGCSLVEAARRIEQQRPESLGKVKKSLRGDLEVIVAQALAKERDQRYSSAGGVAEDLERHLSHRPILAHSPSRLYQARKFVRRNPLLVLGSVALLLLTTGFAITMAVQNQRISHQRDVAARKSQVSWEVVDFLVELFRIAEPDASRTKQLSAKDVLDVGATRIQTEFHEDPLLRSELLLAMGRTYIALGALDRARPLLEETMTLRKASGLSRGSLEEASMEWGLLLNQEGNYVEAHSTLEALLEQVKGAEGGDQDLLFNLESLLITTCLNTGERHRGHKIADGLYQRELSLGGSNSLKAIKALYLRGVAAKACGLYQEALPDVLEALERGRAEFGEDHSDVISFVRGLCDLYTEMGLLDDAIEAGQLALQLDRKVFGDNHPNVDNDLYELASIYGKKGQLEEALERFLEVYERDKINLGDHPYVGVDLTEIGSVLSRLGRTEEADDHFERGYALQQRLYPEDHFELATTLSNMANHAMRSGEPAKALELHKESLRIRLKTMSEDHPYILSNMSGVAVAHAELKNYSEAEKLHRKILEIRLRTLPDHPSVAGSLCVLGHTLYKQGKYEEAKQKLEEAKNQYLEFHDPDHLKVARAVYFYGLVLLAEEEFVEAEPMIRVALASRRKYQPNNISRISSVELSLASCLAGQGDWEEARALFQSTYNRCRETHEEDHYMVQRIQDAYKAVCEREGKPVMPLVPTE